jgi:hypothetical protein
MTALSSNLTHLASHRLTLLSRPYQNVQKSAKSNAHVYTQVSQITSRRAPHACIPRPLQRPALSILDHKARRAGGLPYTHYTVSQVTKKIRHTNRMYIMGKNYISSDSIPAWGSWVVGAGGNAGMECTESARKMPPGESDRTGSSVAGRAREISGRSQPMRARRGAVGSDGMDRECYWGFGIPS